jgi:hypothetical protein
VTCPPIRFDLREVLPIHAWRTLVRAALSVGMSQKGDAEFESEDDLVDRVYEHRKNDEARQREPSAEHPKSAGQRRAEASTQNAKQFLREIYRKLASAVHPDREADAARRAEKTELMQRINRAYATNDLLTLLETQLQLELIDPDHVSKISGQRLKQFNQLLSQQLDAPKAELRSLQDAFRMACRTARRSMHRCFIWSRNVAHGNYGCTSSSRSGSSKCSRTRARTSAGPKSNDAASRVNTRTDSVR